MYKLPPLPYKYDALEPYIDAKTMEIHYTKHHQTYIDNLNKALENHPDLQKIPLIELLEDLTKVPQAIREAVRNNGGGHQNHSMFWLMMGSIDKQPAGKLKKEIEATWQSFDNFKEQFSNTAKSVFGSGWAWLALDQQSKLVIISSPNQDNPVSKNLAPILGLDVWEHAYYLKYQNKRVDYIAAWWHVINWSYIEELYNSIA